MDSFFVLNISKILLNWWRDLSFLQFSFRAIVFYFYTIMRQNRKLLLHNFLNRLFLCNQRVSELVDEILLDDKFLQKLLQ